MKKKKSFHSLAEALRFWVEEKNFDLKSAAQEFGISSAALHNLLRGDLPKRETLYRIAKRIGISDSHAFILDAISRRDTPDRIKELLHFFYEKTMAAPELEIVEVIKELYPSLDLSPEALKTEERQLRKVVEMLLRLKWTTEYWRVAQNMIANLLAQQDQYFLDYSMLGQEEYLGAPHDLNDIFRQMASDERKGVKLFYLDRKESPRGYVMSAVSIPRGYGAFEFGAVTTYGFEMGMVLRGEGFFFSKGLRKDKAYHCQPFKDGTAICFSRHRSHCIWVTSERMEILNIQIPFAASHLTKPPISFRAVRGKNKILCTPSIMYAEGSGNHGFRARVSRPQAARLPEDLEKLILARVEDLR